MEAKDLSKSDADRTATMLEQLDKWKIQSSTPGKVKTTKNLNTLAKPASHKFSEPQRVPTRRGFFEFWRVVSRPRCHVPRPAPSQSENRILPTENSQPSSFSFSKQSIRFAITQCRRNSLLTLNTVNILPQISKTIHTGITNLL